MVNENIMYVLIEDVNTIHEETNIRITEIDDRVNESIALVTQGKMAMLPHLEELRIELWSKYTEENIKQLEKYIRDLSLVLVKVSSYKADLMKIKRRLEHLKRESDDPRIHTNYNHAPELIKLFNDTTKLWNRLNTSEEDLRREAWFNFINRIFLPYATIVSGAYWGLIYAEYIPLEKLNEILIWWTILLFLLYWGLLNWAKNPFKIEEQK